MEKLEKENFKAQIKAYFKKESGLSITEAKKRIKAQLEKNEFENSISAGNVRLFYTSNPNFCNGVKNGFGPGWYLTNKGFNGGATVKI